MVGAIPGSDVDPLVDLPSAHRRHVLAAPQCRRPARLMDAHRILFRETSEHSHDVTSGSRQLSETPVTYARLPLSADAHTVSTTSSWRSWVQCVRGPPAWSGAGGLSAANGLLAELDRDDAGEDEQAA